ncbi:MAG: metallophosphoesterase [Clostridia bacterium]|nr:metallophosphoesterase [Clostridia bacterium]
MSISTIITSIILSIFTFFSSLMSPSFAAPVPQIEQDDFIPVLRFVATSDTHIEKLGDTGCKRISAMLKTAYAISDADEDYKSLDAVVFSGDLTDNGLRKSFYAFAATTDNEIREGTERLAVVAKAHDSYRFSKNSLKVFSEITGQEPDFHRVIGGFHFIGISRSNTLKHYTDDQIKWLDENIAEAVAAAPEQPVFVFQHEHVRDTVYGSSKTDGWGLDVFTEVLKKYPQVVHISGHSHFPANDPRAVWQGEFTAINDGGLAYYELAVDGKNGQFPEEKGRMSQALIVEVDSGNRVLVRVLDVDAGKIMREFLIDNITEKNKTKYSFEARKEKASAPFFPEGSALSCRKDGLKYYITVPQAEVSEDNEVFIYRISVLNKKGKTIYKDWAFSDYFFADKPDSITFEGFMAVGKDLTVKVMAEDVWGNTSEALETELK